MPAPSTIVTFTDAEGDVFPVRVVGHGMRLRVVEIARRALAVTTEEGCAAPAEPVKVTKVEEV